jgi:aryl-alcohol dehydrogenase-like predicted oxidoreductase
MSFKLVALFVTPASLDRKSSLQPSSGILDDLVLYGLLWLILSSRNSAHHRVQEAFNDSLEALGLGYIDLYLMHWPQAAIPAEGEPLVTMKGTVVPPGASPTFAETWAQMEKLLDTGLSSTPIPSDAGNDWFQAR